LSPSAQVSGACATMTVTTRGGTVRTTTLHDLANSLFNCHLKMDTLQFKYQTLAAYFSHLTITITKLPIIFYTFTVTRNTLIKFPYVTLELPQVRWR